MKSSKVISIVLLIGMASQAHGMFRGLGRLGSALTTRNLVAVTAAAAMARPAYAEKEQESSRRGKLLLGKKDAAYSPISWLPRVMLKKKVEALQWFTNGQLVEVPTERDSRPPTFPNSTRRILELPVFSFEKCVKKHGNNWDCVAIAERQQEYALAARAMTAALNDASDAQPWQRDTGCQSEDIVVPESVGLGKAAYVFRCIREEANVAPYLDHALLWKHFWVMNQRYVDLLYKDNPTEAEKSELQGYQQLSLAHKKEQVQPTQQEHVQSKHQQSKSYWERIKSYIGF